MTSTPRDIQPRPRASDSGVALADPHSFLYERVRIYARILTIFFGAFAIIGAIKVIVMPFTLLGWLGVLAQGLFVVVAVATTSTWLYLRRVRPSIGVLHGLESGGSVLAGVTLGAAVHVMPLGIVQLGIFLAVLLMLIVRAAIVPSTATRTLTVGVIISVAIGALAAHRTVALGHELWTVPPEVRPDDYNQWAVSFMWVIMGSWGVIFSLATAIVSRVIYRLTSTARQALKLGNYTIDRKLGEGGMGEVYLAHHALMARPAALKLLPPEKTSAESVRRFEREVQKTSELEHPNTVRVFDFGYTPDGTFYYVMEYLDGLDLRELVGRHGPLPPGRVIHVLAQVAHALGEAHRHGLVHRDIKPDNIVLCDLGGVADMAKLLDFGLVRDIDPPSDLTLSSEEKIAGTPMYMAPETITAPSAVDGRSDIYAIGCVAYFLLSGGDVFDAATVVEVCGHHLHTIPASPSERLGKDLPDDLEAVVLRCLEKKPEDRYADALALRAALLACTDGADWDMETARSWWDAHPMNA